VAVVSRGSDGLAPEPPAGCVQPGLLTTCQPVGSLPWRGPEEARTPQRTRAPARPAGKPRCCHWRRDRARPAPPCSTSWTAGPGTPPSTSTSRWSGDQAFDPPVVSRLSRLPSRRPDHTAAGAFVLVDEDGRKGRFQGGSRCPYNSGGKQPFPRQLSLGPCQPHQKGPRRRRARPGMRLSLGHVPVG
jgi:hypothetical protein